MTCGGLDFSSKLYGNTKKNISHFSLSTDSNSFISDNCYSLQKGSWVKKASMLKPANGLGASPYPDTPNSLAVSSSKDIDILLPGESWKRKLDFPGSSTLYLHCQATLGPSIIITGR